MMEQIPERLLGEMNAMEERMKAKIWAQIKTNRGEIKTNQERIGGQDTDK
jgi:hypothetical protein